MDRFSDSQFPLCRFGPGGDFIKDWPFGKIVPKENSLGRVLDCIAQIIGGMSQTNDETVETILSAAKKKDKANGKDSGKPKADSKADRTIEDNCKPSPQPLLFADISRTGSANRTKPKHRIRAHSPAAKKRTPNACQGSN